MPHTDTIVEPVNLPTTSPIPTVGANPVFSEDDMVDAKSTAYKRMESKWELLHDLLGGTEAMREAGERWLPVEPKEEIENYARRLARSILYNALETTYDNLVSKPFAKAVTTKGEELLSPQVQEIIGDTDKNGTDLTTFIKDVFRKGLEYGLTHVFVDYPNVSVDVTLAEELELNIRPSFVRIDPPDLLGWRTTRTPVGDLKLIQIRFREWRIEQVGNFGDREVEHIRVYNAPPDTIDLETGLPTPGTWELWKRNDELPQRFELISSGTHTYPGIPVVTFYTNRTGYMEGLPPFEDLMWLNVAHWQTLSDVRNVLRMVLSAIFYAVGVDPEQLKEMVFGPNVFLKSSNASASFGFAEHSGAGINAGRQELSELEARMEQLGLKPLIERSSRSTATAKIIDETRTSTDIQAWVRVLETVMVQAFEYAETWVSEEISEDFQIDVFDDFGITEKATEDLAELRAMRQLTPPALDIRTYLEEVKRRGLLADDVDLDVVLESIAAELLVFGPGGPLSDTPPEEEVPLEDEEVSEEEEVPEDEGVTENV